jgi:hypothetical protein
MRARLTWAATREGDVWGRDEKQGVADVVKMGVRRDDHDQERKRWCPKIPREAVGSTSWRVISLAETSAGAGR